MEADGTARHALDTMKHFLCVDVVHKNLKSNVRMTRGKTGSFCRVQEAARLNSSFVSGAGFNSCVAVFGETQNTKAV